ncbi:carboxylate-amine ligase [Actinophytocola oryzae]|uniref:Putative glutamate--cysteine ligase 2 n=1 Tax=Actinophytocola oryzae TaxID=502181 RepID=A0A4R7W385_9PSEU|nr:glutamate--cysteine ligase [Actinophytocola oryzae]TDV56057.1 carboxylate-amine ligase [Actinophytocola oryzae]
MAREGRLTVGVEEEYLIVDAVSRATCAEGPLVADSAADELGARVGTEFTRFQVEARTDPHDCLLSLGEQVRAMRAATAVAAARHGVRAVSSGTPVLGELTPPPVTADPRYAASLARFRALNDEQSACACHVHVGLAERPVALRVSNHLRPWLPVLVAISANSPYWAGRDTGYASWRAMGWARWPAAGPPPFFHSPAHFDDLLGRLRDSGAIMDSAGVYWDVRPSHHLPTVEVRVADAATTPGETQLFAALVRGLVDTAVEAIAAGEPDPDPEPEILRTAYWRAARDGLSGHAVDPHTARLQPTRTRVVHLLAHIRDAARRNGDHDLIEREWLELAERGCGADRQRAVRRVRGRLTDVVDHLTLTATHARQ